MALVKRIRRAEKEIEKPVVTETNGSGSSGEDLDIPDLLGVGPEPEIEPEPLPTPEPVAALPSVSDEKIVKEGKLTLVDTPKYLARYKDDRVAPRVWFKLQQDIAHDYWPNLIVYVYRVLPRIMRKRVNPRNPSNIGSYVQPLTEQDVLRAHGWGMYMLTLNDVTRKIQTCVCRCVWKPDVPMDEYPPKLDLHELDVENPENRAYVDYLRLQGKLDGNGNVVEPNQQNSAAPGGMDPNMLNFFERQQNLLMNAVKQNQQKPGNDMQDHAISKAIDIVAQGGTRANELMMAQIKQADPGNTIELVKTLLATVRPPQDSSADLMKYMMANLETARAENQTLLKGLLERKNEDPAEQFLKWREVFNSMKGNGDEEPKTWKEKLLEHAIEVLPNVIQVIMMNMSRGKGQTVVQTNQGQPSPMNTGLAGELPPAQPTQQTMIQQQLAAYGHLIVKAVARGEDGNHFAESMEALFGVESGVYPAIHSLGKEGIVAALQSVPEVWNALAPMAGRLDKFLDEFLSWGNPEPEGVENEA